MKNYDLNITEIQDYLNSIAALEEKVRRKDMKISLLEFELSLEKSMVACFRDHYQRSGVK